MSNNGKHGESDRVARPSHGWMTRAAGGWWPSAVCSIVLVAAAALLRHQFLQRLGLSAPYITFFPAVSIAALYGGLLPGLLASALSAVAASYYWVEPVHTFAIKDSEDWLLLVVFLATATIISITAEAMYRAQARAYAATAREISRANHRESEAQFKMMVDSIMDYAVFMLDTGGRIVSWNSGAERIKGYRPDEIIGQHFSQFYPREDVERGKPERALEVAITVGRFEDEDWRVRKDGSRFIAHVVITAIRDDADQLCGFVKVTHDLTERRQAEDALLGSAERLRLAQEAGHIGVFDYDYCNGSNYWSPQLEALYGLSAGQFPGTFEGWMERVHPDDRAEVERQLADALETGQYSGEFRIIWPDGSVRSIYARGQVSRDERGQPTRMVGVNVDVTERKQLEAQFRQAQKMENMGLLAGGIAHDFNNLLTVINGIAALAIEQVRDGDPLNSDLHEIRRAGEQAATLTRQLLAFSRKQILQPQVLNLNTVVEKMEGMLRRLLGEDVDLVVVPTQCRGCVKADAAQIEQVLANLAVNARDAMPHGGQLTIEVQHVKIDEQYGRQRGVVAQPAPYVMLAISDTGMGMDEATRKRIFEPFFTTKGPAHGTGLGLSIVYGIVEQSGGFICVYSEVGQGTSFKIYLPQAAEEATPKTSPPTVMPLRGTETVLVVEDMPGLRHLATRLLVSAGFTVLTAANGEEALLLLERDKQPVHLLLTDVVMPGMGGRILAERLQTLRPAARVLYISGYTEDVVVRHGVLDQHMPFLSKPFNAVQLISKVREVLDSEA